MKPDLRNEICMSLMRALWGEIGPAVRAVLARPKVDQGFGIEIYIDGGITDQDMQSASDIEGLVMGDFSPETDISHKVVRLDAPLRIPVGDDGLLVYRRREAPYFDAGHHL